MKNGMAAQVEWERYLTLGRALRPLLGLEGNHDLLAGEITDWRQFIRFSGEQLILPALACSLADLPSLPQDLRSYFSEIRQLTRERNTQMLRAFFQVSVALNDIGVQPLPLKGAAMLTRCLYPDLGARIMGDLDILVPDNRLADAVRVLQVSGYRPVEEQHASHHHAAAQFNPETRCEIELHREPLKSLYQDLLPASRMMSRAEYKDVNGARIMLPDCTDLALSIMVHSELSDGFNQRRQVNFRAMFDLALLKVAAPVDWDEIGSLLRRSGKGRIWRDTRALLAHLFGSEFAEAGAPPQTVGSYKMAAHNPLRALALRVVQKSNRHLLELTTGPRAVIARLRTNGRVEAVSDNSSCT